MKSEVVRDPFRGFWLETYYLSIITQLSYFSWNLVPFPLPHPNTEYDLIAIHY